jgi:hypothetical protein
MLRVKKGAAADVWNAPQEDAPGGPAVHACTHYAGKPLTRLCLFSVTGGNQSCQCTHLQAPSVMRPLLAAAASVLASRASSPAVLRFPRPHLSPVFGSVHTCRIQSGACT